MKKTLSLFLAILMVTAVFPLSFFAAEAAEAVDADNVTVVYDNELGKETVLGNYATIDAAFEALEQLYTAPLADNSITDTDGDGNIFNELYAAAGSPVIKLNKSFTVNSSTSPLWLVGTYINKDDYVNWNGGIYNKDRVPTFVVEGNGYTLTCGAISIFEHMAFYNLKVKNTNFAITDCKYDNSFTWYGRVNSTVPLGESFTTFENCKIDQDSTEAAGSSQGSLFKMDGRAKAWQDLNGNTKVETTDTFNDTVKGDIFNLTLKDCTITSEVAVGLQVHWGADANIWLINTSFTLDGTGGGTDNSEAIKFYQAGEIYLSVDENSTVAVKRESGSTRATVLNVLNFMASPTKFNFEKGARFVLDSPDTLTSNSRIFNNEGLGSITVADKGAIWSIGKNDAKRGVWMPKIPGDTSGTYRSFKINGTEYAGGVAYTNANATGSVSMSPVYTKLIYVAGPDTYTGYDSINTAFEWVYSRQNDSADFTIILLGNVTTAKTMYPLSYDHTNLKTIRVDGNGYTLECTATGDDTGIFYGIGLYHLKLSNMTLKSPAKEGLNWSPRAEMTERTGRAYSSLETRERWPRRERGSFMSRLRSRAISCKEPTTVFIRVLVADSIGNTLRRYMTQRARR